MDQGISVLAGRVRMLIIDVDGVMTDGALYYDYQGRIMKRFNVQDGLGIKLAQASGLNLAVITGLSSQAVESRIRELGISHYYHGFKRKMPVVDKLASSENIRLEEMAYIGDDWVDAGPMLRVGLPMAVSNAQPEIIKIAKWISRSRGGDGAVREAVMFILKAQGKHQMLWESWKLADD